MRKGDGWVLPQSRGLKSIPQRGIQGKNDALTNLEGGWEWRRLSQTVHVQRQEGMRENGELRALLVSDTTE